MSLPVLSWSKDRAVTPCYRAVAPCWQKICNHQTTLARRNIGRYERVGRSLGMTASAVGVAIHRLRKRYREAMRATIAETTESDRDAELEFEDLARILTQSQTR